MNKENLLITVSSFFETQSHKLVTDEFGKPILTLEAWEQITKSLLLLEFPKQEPIITDYGKINRLTSSSSALIELDISKTDRLIENIYEFSFLNLFPQIIIRLNLERPESAAFRYVIENKGEIKGKISSYGYNTLKSWINFYYGIIGKTDKATAELITGTARGILQRIIGSIGSDEIYADTDTVFFTNSKKFTDGHTKLMSVKSYADYIGLPYEIDHYACGIFYAKKKYILFKNIENVRIRGFKKINFGN
jgi:hypothetical protein